MVREGEKIPLCLSEAAIEFNPFKGRTWGRVGANIAAMLIAYLVFMVIVAIFIWLLSLVSGDYKASSSSEGGVVSVSASAPMWVSAVALVGVFAVYIMSMGFGMSLYEKIRGLYTSGPCIENTIVETAARDVANTVNALDAAKAQGQQS